MKRKRAFPGQSTKTLWLWLNNVNNTLTENELDKIRFEIAERYKEAKAK